MKKHIYKAIIRVSIIYDFFRALWKYKLWWGIPIILVLAGVILLLLVAGHTGGVAFIYPLF